MSLHHNRPPASADPLYDRLAEDYAELVARANALVTALQRVPETLNAQTAARATDYTVQLKRCRDEAEAARKAEKDPFLKAGRTVDNFFTGLTGRLDDASGKVRARIAAHMRAQAAEAAAAEPPRTRGSGSVATLRQDVGCEIEDDARAVMELRSYIDDAALQRAARAYAGDHRERLLAATRDTDAREHGMRFFRQDGVRVR